MATQDKGRVVESQPWIIQYLAVEVRQVGSDDCLLQDIILSGGVVGRLDCIVAELVQIKVVWISVAAHGV